MRLLSGLVSTFGPVNNSAYCSLDWPKGAYGSEDIYQLQKMVVSSETKAISDMDQPLHEDEILESKQQDDVKDFDRRSDSCNSMTSAASSVSAFPPGAEVPLGVLPGESTDETSDTTILIPGGLDHKVDIHTSSLAPMETSSPDLNLKKEGGGGSSSTLQSSCEERPKRRRKCRECLRSGCCLMITMVTMIVLGGMSIIAYFFLEPFIYQQLRQNLVLQESLTKWAKPDERPSFSMYLFNITNAEDVLSHQVPLKVQQMGPYVYRLRVEKVNVTWNDNGTVSYREQVFFEPDLKRTQGSEDDIVTTVNLPLAGLVSQTGHTVAGWLDFESKNIFETRTVKELLWGYESDVLKKIGSYGNWDFFSLIPDLHNIDPIFGLLREQNGTLSPPKTVYTGADDFSKLNDVSSWNYLKKLKFWATKTANEIRGTDGSMFRPFKTEDSNLTVFYNQLFRTFDLEFQERVQHSKVNALRFIIPDSQFSTENLFRGKPNYGQYDSSDEDRDEEDDDDKDEDDKAASDDNSSTEDDSSIITGGYCTPECLPDGVYSIASASKGVPMMVSMPHFLGADPSYTEHIEGLEPSEHLHRTWFDVDELTGVTVYNRRRHQINIRLSDPGLLAKYIPLFWNDIEVELTTESMSNLDLATTVVHYAKAADKYLLGFSIFCGIIALIAPAIYCYQRHHRRRLFRFPHENLGKPNGYVLV